MISPMTPMMMTYTTMMASIRGSFSFCKKFTKGFNKKNKNPDIRIGKNRVEKKIPIGSNKNEIFVDMYMMPTIMRICNAQY